VLASSLWREVPDNAMVLVDSSFLAAETLGPLTRGDQNRHWMTRAKSTTKWTVLKTNASRDDLVELQISAESRTMDSSLLRTYTARGAAWS
jgi:hypothetical protein